MKLNLTLRAMSIVAGAAIIISFASCTSQQAHKKSGKELFSSFYKPYHDDSDGAALRGGNKGAELNAGDDEQLLAMRAEGITAYTNANYTQAITVFEQYMTHKANDQVVPFYLGGSYLAIDKPEKAQANFEKILAKPDGVFFDNAQWFTALILVDKEDYAKAKEILEKIISTPDHYYRSMALDLVGQVDYMLEHK